MGTQYSHIDLAERRRIQKIRDAKVPVAVIAAELGRHTDPTVSGLPPARITGLIARVRAPPIQGSDATAGHCAVRAISPNHNLCLRGIKTKVLILLA